MIYTKDISNKIDSDFGDKASYANRGQEETPRRIRDFNKTFDNCETGVNETGVKE